MERTRREFLRDAGLLVGGLALTALGVGECESDGAATTPIGEVFWGNEIGNPTTEAHEDCHNRLRKKLGNREYYRRYFQNPCAEELRCGADPSKHPACKGK